MIVSCRSDRLQRTPVGYRNAPVARTALLTRAALAALTIVAAAPRLVAAAVILNGNYIQLPIDNTSARGRFMADSDSAGAKYNPAGTGGASGTDFWVAGTPVYNYTVAINGTQTRINGSGWTVPPVVTDTTSGTTNSATISGQPFPGLTFTRTVSFGDSQEFVTITDTLTNGGATPLSQVATLDNTDPDQDAPSTFATFDDVVSVQVPNDLAVASGVISGLTLGFGSPSALRVVDFSGFSNTNPYPILAAPSDPNGTAADIGQNIAFNYGTLAAGASKSATWYIVFSPSKAGALTTYAQATGCGDGVVGPGEQCDDANATSGDGCGPSCQVEACYACSGEPSTCSPLPDGSDCDDGLFCNGMDTCTAGACSVHGSDPCSGGAECADVCDEVHDLCATASGTPCTDDGNVCTDDQCDGAGACVHTDNFFVPCDDGLFCNGTDFCDLGSCSIHELSPCAINDCANGCDEMADACVPNAAGTPCIDDGNVCTTDQCNGTGFCAHLAAASGTPCVDDGQICTIDQCNGFGACTHPPRASGFPCPGDGNACTKDQCNGAGACAHPAEPDGTACSDADACTQTDQCVSGQCVGSDPVICAPSVCRAPSACDPSTGICTTCPSGYSQAGGGCQQTYPIDATLLDNLFNFCDGSGLNRYTCFGPYGFHWNDTADDSVGEVTRVDVTWNNGLECGVGPRPVTLNGSSIGIYASTAAACDCAALPRPLLLADVDSGVYAKGSTNAVSIFSSDCTGLRRGLDGHYASVTVTYADPGATYIVRNDCRQAGRSKLKYVNRDVDAKDKLLWKWGHGEATTPAELADPTASTDYQLCVYAEGGGTPTLLFGADVPAGGGRWTKTGSVGYRYIDTSGAHDGISRMLLKRGAPTKSKIIVKGVGAALGDPAFPLASIDEVRVQLTNQSTGVCWESEFPVSSLGDRINLKGP